jgi:hypothetical protein
VEFAPFSLEAGEVWGPAARRFWAKCLYLAGDDRDIDVYPTCYWSFGTRAGASERGGLPRGLAQADPGPSVLGPEPCLGRLRAAGAFDDFR